VKNAKFEFNEACLNAFSVLKEKFILSPIIMAPDWDLPFELMCNASEFTIGADLGQRKGTLAHVIYYASKVLNSAQINFATTQKELLAYAFDKFRPYLIGPPSLKTLGSICKLVTNAKEVGIFRVE
jgi:hypothetical protein